MLTDKDRVAIARWLGWEYQGDLARPERKWRTPAGAWSPGLMIDVTTARDWVQLFEKLAIDEGFFLFWTELLGEWVCAPLQEGGVWTTGEPHGTGETPGEAVVRAALSVVAFRVREQEHGK